jgi:hypothetical protein
MTLSAFFLMLAFLVAAGIQYGLVVHVLRDLTHRQQLRGANKITWTLIILCLPFIGPLLYSMLATDGLPVPKPAPDSTWPGKRWRMVQRFGRRGQRFLRGAEAPREPDPWEDLPISHDVERRDDQDAP